MSLLITVLKSPDSVDLQTSSKTFEASGGSLGRGADNVWVLDDPERYLSTHHCRFSSENGQYYLTDQSTNGTFLNGSPDPMGKGTKLPVKDQDTFMVGDYEFSIQVVGDSGFPSALGSAPSPFADDFNSASPVLDADGFASSPFSSGKDDGINALFGNEPVETDPLAALDKARGQADPLSPEIAADAAADPFAAGTHSDQSDVMNQQISWPQAVQDPASSEGGGAIPDDWDDDLLSDSSAESPQPTSDQFEEAMPLTGSIPVVDTEKPSIPRPGAGLDDGASLQRIQQLAADNARLQDEVDSLKRKLKSKKTPVSSDTVIDTTLIQALGFADKQLSEADISQINELAGDVLREMVKGLMQVLGSRSSIKNEFRMNVTTIQPVENNPLKFSANVDDALENMFLKQGNAFKKPIEAVQEGFEGVAEHQMAILAGIREAFKVVIERFDPARLEERFTRQNKGGLVLGSQKAKNWEAFVDYYTELVGDIDKSFQYLYGDGFVRAYEDQLQKLAINKKAQSFTKDK